ncbi:3-hydroxyacyl-CoA dehydrogenase NAD-binding domain-containing protein [Pseudorhodoferax sp. Leaf274]|uniref:3-hydroxyacyl-CoA dehydrogenase NAD-binding domain-containing protein n=1 Tax=Pseudorhodoferax sp. Leaf274 TaxID=1736318 RepID=UPI0007039F0B|nr:3-hydroxyacyl-CoA dehydrogenase NAD-binding domain-containing protein [Pseudorhodoferax sp. Leaf274]KQP45486.1 3-hydroxyacyl-CoA dehydrogenase [Pseudorhodoferax sp. Leaf274]
MVDYQVDGDGVATLAWNVADRPMNVLNEASIGAFAQAVARTIADPAVKGVVVTSARPEFVVGADLDLVRSVKTAEQSMAITAPISRVLRTLERSGKPFVAALNGTALGGGYEIALACHRRIAADDARIQIGLPEVTLGLLPAAGGTQRLPRMIGIRAALPFLLEGRKLAPRQALEAGLVDEVVPAAELLARARAWVLADGPAHAVKPWDAKGFRFPGGTPQAPGPTQLFFGVSGGLLGKTQGLYPAPEAILACLYDGCQVDLDNGLKIEQRQFARLATSAATRNMIRTLFYSMGEANRLADRPKDVPVRKFAKVAVLGAGMMGAGLAHVSAQAGLRVVLLDVQQAAAEKGKAYSQKLLDAQVAKGRLSAGKRDQALALIAPTSDYAALADCDLVIEAVFEDRKVKAEVTRQAEAAMSPGAVFATNTSTLPITSLAEVSVRPAQFVGLHFFSPVEKMPLVEVIRGQQTSEATIAQALDFVKRIRKTPIVVNDCPSFYANRAFAMFPYEAMTMLREGVNPILIENAARMAGMPMPALALTDEISVELLHKALQQARADQGAAYRAQPQDQVLDDMVGKFERIGRKAGKGFYDYPADGRKTLWRGLAEHYPVAAQQPDVEEVRKRLMYAQSLEAARCVAEGIVSVRDADVGSLLGWGFPAALGGAIGYIDTVGAPAFVAECDRLATRHGERYAVPDALRAMAAGGSRYYAV